VPALPIRSPMARRRKTIRSPSQKGAGGGCIDPATLLPDEPRAVNPKIVPAPRLLHHHPAYAPAPDYWAP